MPDKALAKVSGSTKKGSRGGGGTTSKSVKKVRGQGNRSVAAIKAKKIGGSTKQHAGHLVKQAPQTTQGQRGKPGPATKSGKAKGVSGGRGEY
jgi:hypothetical protein